MSDDTTPAITAAANAMQIPTKLLASIKGARIQFRAPETMGTVALVEGGTEYTWKWSAF